MSRPTDHLARGGGRNYAIVSAAGPGLRQELRRRAGAEVAGPACPRLRIEEVGVSLTPEAVEAGCTLSLGSLSFRGLAKRQGGVNRIEQLAAAAAVAALQQYLKQCSSNRPLPRLELLDAALAVTGTGQEFIHATVRLSEQNGCTYLLGSALVRNDRCSTAVAAALDATSRRLGLLCLPPPEESEEAGESLPLSPPEDVATEEVALPEQFPAEPLENPPAPPVREDPPRAEPVAADPLPAEVARRPALGVEITATSVRVAAVGPEGEILAEARRPTRGGADAEATLSAALEAVGEVIEAVNSHSDLFAAVGIAMPGELRVADGVCVSCGDLPSWREVQVAAPFARELGLPVALLGSTAAAALGESKFGAAQQLSRVIYVRLGADIEASLIVDGAPALGGDLDPARVGHMVIEPGGSDCECGQSGCWQALAGRDSVVARALRAVRSGTPSALAAAVDNRLGSITPALVCRMAAGGDAVAREALEETGAYFALGLANLATLLDPEGIVVEGTPPALGTALLRAAEATLKSKGRSRLLSRCVLLSPHLNDTARVLGAAAYASRLAGNGAGGENGDRSPAAAWRGELSA